MTGKRIAITGATGVLGRILVRQLNAAKRRAFTFTGDLRSDEALRDWIDDAKPTHVVHFAAVVPVGAVERDPVTAFDVNAGGTLRLLCALARSKFVPWLFYASTSHVYASKNRALRESDGTEPQTIYGLTKLAGEELVRFFARTGSVRACVGRIFSFYHDTQQQPFLYPTIRARLASHDPAEPFLLRGGNDVRDFMNAEDVVAVVRQLLEREHEGTVNIGSGKGTKIAEFVRQIAGSRELRIDVPDGARSTRLVADTAALRKAIGAA